jgi:hypothetical protein
MFVPPELRFAMVPQAAEENFAGLVPIHCGPQKRYSDDPNGAGSRGCPKEPLHSDDADEPNDADDCGL